MMLAFHSDAKVKEKYLNRVRMHREADQLVQGTAWENGKGCAVGCTLEAYDHLRYETELGIPQMLARLEDVIFEGLSNGKAQAWPERFLKAPRPGADLSLVGWKFLHWLVADAIERHGTEEVKKGCAAALDILKPFADRGPKKSDRAAEAAARAAEAAARAAEAAARAAEAAAEAAAGAAWAAAFERMADKLEELLQEA